MIFLIVVFIAPLCEEIVYRGLLWGAVERLGPGRWVALVVTTLLFALAHFEFTRTPLLLVVAIPIALARLLHRRAAGQHRRPPGQQPAAGHRADARPARRHPDDLTEAGVRRVADRGLAQWRIGSAAGPLPCRGHRRRRSAARNPTRAARTLTPAP